MVYHIISGKYKDDPFEEEVAGLKNELSTLLADAGHSRPQGKWRKGQSIDFGLVAMLGEYLSDPDWECMKEFCVGVRVGVGVTLPRTERVWPPKTRWPLGEYGEDPVTELCNNYPSAKLHHAALLEELQKQVDRGWLLPMTLGEARKRFGTVSVAPLAIIEEKAGQFRTLHDATNGVQVNHRITVLDAEQCPSSLDVQAAMTTDSWITMPLVSLVVDVAKAHRRVPIAEEDWGHLACSATEKPSTGLEDDWPIYVNTVGTYGVASASWHWARFASLFQRLCYYICGVAYMFRYADDFLILSCNSGMSRFTRPLLRFILLCSLLGVPLKWEKTRGGLRSEFIGYLFLWDTLLGGLTDKRTAWLCDWARTTSKNGVVVARDCKAALGRFSFSAALLRYLLPFLGPIYAWVAVLEDGAAWPLPAALRIILGWLADHVEKKGMVPLKAEAVVKMKRYFKADAKAEGSDVVIGGFEVLDDNESLDHCRWFSVSLNPTNAPWAFVKHGEAYRVIAALELFATLLCLMLFVSAQPSQSNTTLIMGGVTDNKGNEALLHKHMTSKFPLYIILMELTELLHEKNIGIDLQWQKREFNVAADALTNGDYSSFDGAKRICPILEQQPWIVLDKLMSASIEMHNEMTTKKESLKIARSLTTVAPTDRTKKRKRKGQTLRQTDPW